MNKGYVVIGGRRFEVYDVLLAHGKIEVCFYINGPQEPFSGPITVFGSDNRGIAQGKTYVITHRIPADTRWDFHYGLTPSSIDTADETVTL